MGYLLFGGIRAAPQAKVLCNRLMPSLKEGAGKRTVVMSTKTVENERHKLTATFFNNIAVGCVLVALIGPVATGKYTHFLTLEFVYSEGAAWGLAAVLHMIARWQLSLLKE